ncbi:Zn-dependent protease with chaperone function [Bacteroidales bacterium 6E]|nr:Zn-dependent protease with chaperone function [Bacteroidales bacterium 6E]
MYSILFIVILVIIVADFLIDRYVDFLNTTRWSDRLPDEVKGIYDEKKYAQQQAYQRENHRFGLLTSTFNFVLVLGMLLLFGFAWLNSVVLGWTASPVWAALLFFGILMMAAEVVNLPFAWYDTFVIEEKYGFNQSSVRTFVFDKLKGWALTMVLGGALMALIVWLYGKAGSWFWVVAWAVLSGFSVFMAMFYSSLIVPLFNKQTPLGEGELRTAIEEFSGKVGFKIDNIFVIDGSRRSSKANAYFTGLGSKKRIVLYDTLIEEMTTEELVAVLAHEIGHYRKRHVVQGLFLGIAQTGLLLFLFSVVMKSPAISQALGVEQPNFHIGMIAFSILYSPLSMVTGLAMNRLSRKNEFEADAFAAENYSPTPLITALKKLSVKNLSNLTPHPVYVTFNYSHPPLLQRLEHLHKFENR